PAWWAGSASRSATLPGTDRNRPRGRRRTPTEEDEVIREAAGPARRRGAVRALRVIGPEDLGRVPGGGGAGAGGAGGDRAGRGRMAAVRGLPRPGAGARGRVAADALPRPHGRTRSGRTTVGINPRHIPGPGNPSSRRARRAARPAAPSARPRR